MEAATQTESPFHPCPGNEQRWLRGSAGTGTLPQGFGEAGPAQEAEAALRELQQSRVSQETGGFLTLLMLPWGAELCLSTPHR